MLIEITDHAVIAYQQARLKEGAAGKTINEEVGELFRIMGAFGEAVRLQLKRGKKLKLPEREDVGRALSADEEKNVLVQARASVSAHIYSAVVIALNTGLRDPRFVPCNGGKSISSSRSLRLESRRPPKAPGGQSR
jgi:hypothetical protein